MIVHPRPWCRSLVCLVLLLLAAGSAAQAQMIQIADEEQEIIETAHPYPTGGPGLEPVWTHTLTWPQASFIAVHFERFELADGDLLVLTDPDGRYRHVYNGLGLQESGGDFWGLSILGDTMKLTLLSKNPVHDGYGLRIDRWTHGYPIDSVPGNDALCGTEDFQDVECYSGSNPTEYDKARAAVRLIKNGSAHCTGWLASCENHIITNEHCVGSQAELNQVEFQFLYQRPNCGSGTATTDLQLQGGTLLEFNSGLDYALIMPALAGNDPQSVYGFMQTDTRLPDIDEPMYIPGHPSGDPKRLSLDSTHPEDQSGRCEVFSTNRPACTGGPVPDIGYYCDTEGGSSGSPVLSGDTHKVIALHHCANCPNRGSPMVDVYDDIQASGNPLPACSTSNCSPSGVPQSLVASTPQINEVQLDWQPVLDAVLYRIYRSTDSCETNMTEIATTTTESYVDSAVSAGVTYYYKVSSESGCGAESARSNCSTATPTGSCSGPPTFAGVESVTNASTSNCAIDVGWSAATSSCGSVSYNVYRSTFVDFEPGPGNVVASCVTGLGWQDTDVLEGARYHYVVRAEDAAGAGGGPCSGGEEDANAVSGATEALGPDDVIYGTDFATSAGWFFSGEWGVGAPQGRGGTADGGLGGPDPSQALFGTNVLGHDLSGAGASPGNYENNLGETEFSFSPAISTQGHDVVRVRFHRWLSVNGTPDTAAIEACNMSITSYPEACTTLWSSPSVPVRDNGWVLMDLDASGWIANLPQARIRFEQLSDPSGTAAGWNVDRLEVYEPTVCASGAAGVAPVPDGAFASGTAMTASRGTGGTVDLEWDVNTCGSPRYNLFFGDAAGLAGTTYSGSRCDLDVSGQANVSLPDPPVGDLVWWVLAGAEGGVEGVHGYTSQGSIRPLDAGGACSVASQSTAGTCP